MTDDRSDPQPLKALWEEMAEMRAILARIEAALISGRPKSTRPPGRKTINDVDALQEVRDLIAQGSEQWAALQSVGRTMGGNWKAHCQRLRRKLRDDHDHKPI